MHALTEPPLEATDVNEDGPPSDAEERFRALFESAYDDLCRFVRRRISDGDDVVAETFLVAWRRFDDVPTDRGEARAWLFGVARKQMANRRRKDARLIPWSGADGVAPDETGVVEARIDMGRAFSRLSARDQETLALVAWDGLTPPQAARVLGISANAYTVRLHRARRRLRAALAEPQLLETLAARLGSEARTEGSTS